MLEAIVFAITLVVAQTLAGLVITRLIMSKAFIKRYYKWVLETMNELTNMELGEEEEES